MTEAVSLGELLHEEALFGQKGGSTPRTLIPVWTLPLRHISAWPDPLPTGLNGDGKNVQTLWWAELDRLHSMTRAHPPLVWSLQFLGKGSFWGRGQRVLQIISLTTLEDLISQMHVLQVLATN